MEILATEAVHEGFVEFAKHGSKHGAWIGAYVLMPNHLHFFVMIDGEQVKLATWMKSLKNELSKTLRSASVLAPHWQKGFFDHILCSVESYSQKWAYVRENPVRGGFVKEWEDWSFCGEIFLLEYRSDA
jgi:REP element-mobilizing transposase RayT